MLSSAFFRFLISALALSFAAETALAEPTFYAQCHRLLPFADEFAQDCLTRARPFSRVFYPGGGSRGEGETYSAHFRPLSEPSRFLLGCVLDFKRKINFLGLYYSARPLDMTRFNEYEIAFIDPSDNVGLTVDGAQATLVAVRQFVTSIVAPRLTGRPKNCEDPGIETIDDVKATALEHYRAVEPNQMEFCVGASCRIDSFRSFFGLHSAPIIYSNLNAFLIDANGVLLVRDKFLQNACGVQTKDSANLFNIIFEACPMYPR